MTELGASAGNYLQRPLDFGFRQTVNSACGFIKNENFGISQHGTAMQTSCRWPAEIPTRLLETDPPRFPCGNRAGCYGEYLIPGNFRMGQADVVEHYSGKRKFCWVTIPIW